MKKTFKILLILFLLMCCTLGAFYLMDLQKKNARVPVYLAGEGSRIEVLTPDGQAQLLTRGCSLMLSRETRTVEDVEYTVAYIDETAYLVKEGQTVEELSDAVLEKNVYTSSIAALYEKPDDYRLLTTVPFNTLLEVKGHGDVLEDGSVAWYEVNVDGISGFLRPSDVSVTQPEAVESRLASIDYNPYGGGSPADITYLSYEKGNFEDNPMPREVKAIYINKAALDNIDPYIELALKCGINAFVIDMKESDGLSYFSPIAREYSPSSYEQAYLDYDTFKENVKKVNDAGIYTIGRIVTFKDNLFAQDHPEWCLSDKDSGKPFLLANSYWPSPYQKEVWEYNVALALEGVRDIGFNEIQFDYVRFPDRISSVYDRIDFKNTQQETPIMALQGFLVYAREQLHLQHAYLSVDVFGETSNDYVTAYGQYWPMISSICDVISAMPYPNHFGIHDYGITEAVWTVPGKLLDLWSMQVVDRQNETISPAKVRTWLQGFDAYQEPETVYDASMVVQQIDALYKHGLDDGYMIWNAPSNLDRYYSYASVFIDRVE